MAQYIERLNQAIRSKQTPALVGLDPRFDHLPQPVIRTAEDRRPADRWSLMATAYEEFCCRVIDVVAPLVPAVKPQVAFFEACGPAGSQALLRVVHHARNAGLIVLCDAKRGDIGSTAAAYAEAYLAGDNPHAAPWGADALTVNPFLGRDALEPFVRTASRRGAGVYVLVRTSNPGAQDFQDVPTRSPNSIRARPLYRHVAAVVEELAASGELSDGLGCVGAVVGATYPNELATLRLAMPHVPFLVPGYGAQGAGAADVAAAFMPTGLGALVNSSRAINFAHLREPYSSRYGAAHWEQAVEEATRAMIDDLAAHTPAGLLKRSDR